eukprot:XP_001705397.1 Hypothetical protein GL50803_24140 [Giardia lamblia ATCC 50803]
MANSKVIIYLLDISPGLQYRRASRQTQKDRHGKRHTFLTRSICFNTLYLIIIHENVIIHSRILVNHDVDLIPQALEKLGLQGAELGLRVIVVSDVSPSVEVVGYVLEHPGRDDNRSKGDTYDIVWSDFSGIPLSKVLQKHNGIGEARPGKVRTVVDVLQKAFEVNVGFGCGTPRRGTRAHLSNEACDCAQGNEALCIGAASRGNFFRHVVFWFEMIGYHVRNN